MKVTFWCQRTAFIRGTGGAARGTQLMASEWPARRTGNRIVDSHTPLSPGTVPFCPSQPQNNIFLFNPLKYTLKVLLKN